MSVPRTFPSTATFQGPGEGTAEHYRLRYSQGLLDAGPSCEESCRNSGPSPSLRPSTRNSRSQRVCTAKPPLKCLHLRYTAQHSICSILHRSIVFPIDFHVCKELCDSHSLARSAVRDDIPVQEQHCLEIQFEGDSALGWLVGSLLLTACSPAPCRGADGAKAGIALRLAAKHTRHSADRHGQSVGSRRRIERGPQRRNRGVLIVEKNDREGLIILLEIIMLPRAYSIAFLAELVPVIKSGTAGYRYKRSGY